MPKLMIIIGSTRPGRAGLPIGDWFAGHARAHGDFDVDVADLAEIGLPLLDEPHHPRLRQYVHQHTRDWSARVGSADVFVIVTPEKKTLYAIAASEYGEQIIKSEIGNDATKALQQWIKRQIEPEKKS